MRTTVIAVSYNKFVKAAFFFFQFFSAINLLAANHVSLHSSFLCHSETHGDRRLHFVDRGVEGYHLNFDDSLRDLTTPLSLLDKDTQVPIGKIEIIEGVFQVMLGNVNTLISQLIDGISMKILQEAGGGTDGVTLTLDAPLVSDLYVHAKRVAFASSIHTDKNVEVIANILETQDMVAGGLNFIIDEFTNTHILRARRMHILAGIGTNRNKILSESNLLLGGSWTNWAILAAPGDIEVQGARFHNKKDGIVIAGGKFLSFAHLYEDEGKLTTAETSTIQGYAAKLGETFNFLGQALKVDTQAFEAALPLYPSIRTDNDFIDDSFGKSLTGKIVIRDYFSINTKEFKEDSKGAIFKSSKVDSSTEAYRLLRDLFGPIKSTRFTAKNPQQGIAIHSAGDVTLYFDIIVQDDGSISIKGRNIEVYGILQHGKGDNDETCIEADDAVCIASNKIGQNIKIKASVKHLEFPDGEEMACKGLYLSGAKDTDSSTYIYSPLRILSLCIDDSGTVSLRADILGPEIGGLPDITIKANDIYADIPALYARKLMLKALKDITYEVGDFLDVKEAMFTSDTVVRLLGFDAESIKAEILGLKAPKKNVIRLSIDGEEMTTEGESFFTTGSMRLGVLKSRETSSILSSADLTVDELNIATGSLLQIGNVKARHITIDGKDIVRFFADFEAEQAHLYSGAGGTHVSKLLVDSFEASSAGSTSLGSGTARILKLDADGRFVGLNLLEFEEEGTINASLGITAQEIKAALAMLRSSEGQVYVGKASGETLHVTGRTSAMVGETTAERSTVVSTESGAWIGKAIGGESARVEGKTHAYAELEGVENATVIAEHFASAKGSAGTLRMEGDTTNADQIKARTLHLDATTYARVDGDVGSVRLRAPMASVTGGSTVGTLTIAANGNIFLNETGKIVKIGTLKVSDKGGKIYNRGTTLIGTADLRDGDIVNHGTLEFTQAALALQSLLNFGQMKFKTPSTVKVGSVMYNPGTIMGAGALDMHLENLFRIGKINVEALTDLVQQIPLQGRILEFNGAGPELSETYVEQVMGMEDNQCGFFALDTTRIDAVNTLLQNIDNDYVRHIIGHELYRSLIEGNEAIALEFFEAAEPLLADIEETQQEIETKENQIRNLKEESIEGGETAEVLEAIRVIEEEITQALLKLDRAKQALKEWCCDKDIFRAYVQGVIGRAGNPVLDTLGHMLEVERDFGTKPLGAMDAIAALQGYALEVYTIDAYHVDGTPILTRIHTFNPTHHGFEGEFTTRRVVITSADVKSNPTARNHYNVLRTQEEANNWRVRLVDPEDRTGTLRLRVQTTRAPESLLSDTNITAVDTLQWFFEGYQSFYNRIPVHQKTAVRVNGKATIYGGFDAKADFSLTADDIKLRQSDITSAGILHLKAAKGNVDADHAKIESKDATVSAVGSVFLHATAVKASKDLTLEAVIDTFLESLSYRVGDGNNYHDVKEATAVKAGGTLRVTAGRHNIHKGSETYSGRSTILEAGGKVIDVPLALERQTYHTFKRGFSRDKYVHQAVSKHSSAGVISSTAQDTQELYAPDLKALAVEIAAKNGVMSHAVYDTHESEYYHKKKRGGIFGGSKTKSSSSSSAYGKGAKLEATEHVKFSTTDGDVILTAIKVNAPRTVVEALKGDVKFQSATNMSSSSTFTTSSNVAWQSYSSKVASDTTYTSSEFSGTVDVHAKEIIIEAVHAETMALIRSLNTHGADLRTNILREVHTFEKKSRGGPTPALAAVVALAITIATSGTGSALGASLAGEMGMVTAGTAATATTAATAAGLTTAGSVVAGMTAGAFTSVCTQAGLALLNSEGDIGKAAKSLLTKDTFKHIMTAAVTAGITRGVTDHYGIKLSGKMDLLGHGKAAGLNAGAGIVGNVTVGGKSLSKSLEPAFVSAVVSAFTAFGANKIGDRYSGTSDAVKLNYITHKISHALLGAAAGAALDKKDRVAGALAGATGAAVAEVVSEMLKSPKLAIDMDGPRLSEEEFKAQYQEKFDAYGRDVSNSANIARLSAATVAMLTGQNVDMANFTASNAINNNFLVLAYYGVVTGSLAWTAYDVYHTFESEGTEAGLKKLGIDAASTFVGGAALRGGGKVVTYSFGKVTGLSLEQALAMALDKMPGLKTILGKGFDAIISKAKAFEATKVGQSLTKVEDALLAGEAKVKNLAGEAVESVKSKFGGKAGAPGKESVNKPPYNSRIVEGDLRAKYPDADITSSTLPRMNEKNVGLAEGRHRITGVVYDHKGFPIFDDVAIFEARISTEIARNGIDATHKSAATRQLSDYIARTPSEASKFTSDQVAAINAGVPKIPGLTWHHHQDIGRMQLINETIHEKTGHVGGSKLWKR